MKYSSPDIGPVGSLVAVRILPFRLLKCVSAIVYPYIVVVVLVLVVVVLVLVVVVLVLLLVLVVLVLVVDVLVVVVDVDVVLDCANAKPRH